VSSKSGAGSSRCGANRKSGGTCGQAPGWGTDHPGVGTCKLHGGSTLTGRKHAETLRTEAWARIMELTDPALTALAALVADDDPTARPQRLGAARDLLDRAGLGARHVHEISGPGGAPIAIEDRTALLLKRAQLLRGEAPVVKGRRRKVDKRAADVKPAVTRKKRVSPPSKPHDLGAE
jgi:hypothetical protein